jgi:hypothetical protein
MNRLVTTLFLGTAFFTASAYGARQAGPETPVNAEHPSATLEGGVTMNATLSESVDAKRSKPGDAVAAKTTSATQSGGQVLLPKGTKLVGHVTESKARAKGESDSTLGIAFDKAVLKDGREIALNHVAVAALAAPPAESSFAAQNDLSAGGGGVGGANPGGRMSGGGGAPGGVRSATGAVVGTAANTAPNVGGAVNSTANAAGGATGISRGAIGGLDANGQLTSDSKGVFGIEGLTLNSASTSATGGSVITSSSRNVHLDSGTRLLLVASANP